MVVLSSTPHLTVSLRRIKAQLQGDKTLLGLLVPARETQRGPRECPRDELRLILTQGRDINPGCSINTRDVIRGAGMSSSQHSLKKRKALFEIHQSQLTSLNSIPPGAPFPGNKSSSFLCPGSQRGLAGGWLCSTSELSPGLTCSVSARVPPTPS